MDEKIQDSLEVSWKEGIPASMMLGIMDYYLVPYGLFLGASTQGIAWLVGLPHLLGSISQGIASRAVRWAGSRLRFIVELAALQAFLLVPAAGLALIAFPGRLLVLVGLVTGFRILANLVGTVWGSLVSEYLPAQKRGAYFGWRSQICGLAGILGVGAGGLILFFTQRAGFSNWGFFLVFFAAALLRFLSANLLARMRDLPLSTHPKADFTFLMFLKRFRQSNFVRFVLYATGLTLSTHLAAPYFSVYMLRDLRWSYLTYTFVHLATIVAGLVSFPLWGRHADVVGNARVLKTTSLLIPVIPFLWLFSNAAWYLVGVEFFAGFVWGGFALCSTNFIYDAVSPEKRVRCLGYFNLINGVAIFAGSMLGGFLADRLQLFGMSSLRSLFLLSGVARFAAHFFFSSSFQEVREAYRPVSSLRLFFSVVGIRPLVGPSAEWNMLALMRRPS